MKERVTDLEVLRVDADRAQAMLAITAEMVGRPSLAVREQLRLDRERLSAG